MRFIWDFDNIKHIADHNVLPEEAEEVLNGETLALDYQNWRTEERFREIGWTGRGRFLEVVITWRGSDIRVATAYDAARTAVREYLESR